MDLLKLLAGTGNMVVDLKLKKLARDIKLKTLDISYKAKTGHIGSALSIADILTVLYFGVLNISKHNIKSDNRDRFILSKGHAAASLYATLYKKGIITRRDLDSFGGDREGLGEHTEIETSGIEMTAGSLGHGLAFGIGVALGVLADKRKSKIFVLLSDGELGEGSVWEAALLGGHLKITNLCVIIDYNKLQCCGRVKDVVSLEPLASKWRSFGWETLEVDGHNLSELRSMLEVLDNINKPLVVIAHTVSGKGIKSIENKLAGHHKVFNQQEYRQAKKELAEL